MNEEEFSQMRAKVQQCTLCSKHLPVEPKPVVQIHPKARILIAGQAPGRKVHESGIPFDDASGDRLRRWLNVDRDTFYNAEKIAILPMGFCYPGTGKSGDLPPRTECADQWRGGLLALMPEIETTLVIGQYSMNWHLKDSRKDNLTQTIQSWRDYFPSHMPLPHPSPRNNIWLKKNPWFEQEVVPALQERVAAILTPSQDTAR